MTYITSPLFKLLVQEELLKLHNDCLCLCDECFVKIFLKVVEHSEILNRVETHMNKYIIRITLQNIRDLINKTFLDILDPKNKSDVDTMLFNRKMRVPNILYFIDRNQTILQKLSST